MLIDGREMAPPEPLELTLAALERLPPDGELTVLLFCQPKPLFAMLRQDGWSWTETLQPDGTHEIRIRRPVTP